MLGALLGIAGLGLNAWGSYKKGEAQEAAAENNVNAQLDINRQQKEWAERVMGATSPSIYPWNDWGKTMEGMRSDAALNFAQQSLATMPDAMKELAGSLGQLQGAPGVIGDTLSGGLMNRTMAGLAPVTGARSAVAATQKDSIMRAISELQNQQSASLRAGGFGALGKPAMTYLTQAAVPAYQAAAEAQAQADYENRLLEWQVRQALENQRLGTAFQAAQSAPAIAGLPLLGTTMAADYLNSIFAPAGAFQRAPSAPVGQLAIQAPRYVGVSPEGELISSIGQSMMGTAGVVGGIPSAGNLTAGNVADGSGGGTAEWGGWRIPLGPFSFGRTATGDWYGGTGPGPG